MKIIEERRLQPIPAPSYQLVCSACGKSYNLENIYVDDQVSGLARYASSLPINSAFPRHNEKCAAFCSAAFAQEIGMENVRISCGPNATTEIELRHVADVPRPRALDVLIGTH